MTAVLRGVDTGVVGADRWGDHAQWLQFAQIQKIKRGDARRYPIRCHAGQLAAGKGQAHQVQALDDIEGEPRIGTGVISEGRQVMAVVMDDFADTIVHIAGNGLALAKHLARDGIERVFLHAHERPA